MIADILQKVRSGKPLVHHITNWVTIYDCAAVTRAFGALPVMAHAVEEAAGMTRISSALVLNIGTLTGPVFEAMLAAGKGANEKGIPVVVDAVGVGATPYRDDAVLKLLDRLKVAVIKGNASEIARLAGVGAKTKGVEAGEVDADLVETAARLAKDRRLTAVITGERDIVTDGATAYIIHNGHPMMGAVVGTGCMAGSAVGSFAAVETDRAKAAAAALAAYGVAGEIAGKIANGPGAFKTALLDAVFNLDPRTTERKALIETRTLA